MPYIRASLHFRLDEPQEMLLVHATGVMHMGVNFSYIVEVTMRNAL
jgi:hypothetical protein